MPVEIRELQITTVIQDNGNTSAPVAGSNSNAAGNNDAIIAKCVEQVLEILKEKSER